MAESSLSLSVTTAHPLSKSEIEKRSSGENPHFSLTVDLPAKKSNKPNRETCYFNTTNNSLSHSSLTTEGNHSTVLNIEKVSKVEGSDQFGYVISTKFLEDHYLQVTDKGSKKRDVRFTTKKSAEFHKSQLFKLAQDPKTEARFALYTSVVDGKGRNKICYLRYEDGSIIAEESSSANKYHCFIFTESYAQMNLQTKGAIRQISGLPKQLTPCSENEFFIYDERLTTSDQRLLVTHSEPLSASEVLALAADGVSLFLVRFPDVDDQYAFQNSTASGDYPLEYRELSTNPNLNYFMGFTLDVLEMGVLWDTIVTPGSFYTAQAARPVAPGSLSAAFIPTEAPLWTIRGTNRDPTLLSFQTTVNDREFSANPAVMRRSSEVVATAGTLFTMEVLLILNYNRNTLPLTDIVPAHPIGKLISSKQPEKSQKPLTMSEIEKSVMEGNPYFVLTVRMGSNNDVCYLSTSNFRFKFSPPLETEHNASTLFKLEKIEDDVFALSSDILKNYYLEVTGPKQSGKSKVKFTEKAETFNEGHRFMLQAHPQHKRKIALLVQSCNNITYELRPSKDATNTIFAEVSRHDFHYHFEMRASETRSNSPITLSASQINDLVSPVDTPVGYFKMRHTDNDRNIKYVLMNVTDETLTIGAEPNPIKHTVFAKFKKVSTTGFGTYRIANVCATRHYFRVTTNHDRGTDSYHVVLSNDETTSTIFELVSAATGTNVGFKTTIQVRNRKKVLENLEVYLQPSDSGTNLVAKKNEYTEFTVRHQRTLPIDSGRVHSFSTSDSERRTTEDIQEVVEVNADEHFAVGTSTVLKEKVETENEDPGCTVEYLYEEETTTLIIKDRDEGIETVVTYGPPQTADQVVNLADSDNQLFIVRFPTSIRSRYNFAYLDTTDRDLRYREAPNVKDLSILMGLKTVGTNSLRWSTNVIPGSFLQLSRTSPGRNLLSVDFVNYDDPSQAPAWTISGERPESTDLSFEGTPAGGTGGIYSIIPSTANIVAASQGRSFPLQVLHVTSHTSRRLPIVPLNPIIGTSEDGNVGDED